MYRRIVIKVGTRVLTDERGFFDESSAESIVRQIASLRRKGIEVIFVSSGAVGSGRELLGRKSRETAEDRQVFAAVGQARLMESYSNLFRKRRIRIAQVLVTKADFRDRNHYHNMRCCFENLLRAGIVPVVNENDTVAIRELVFTDNDELAGLVSAQVGADVLLILTSTDGLLDGKPDSPDAKRIPEIEAAELGYFTRFVTKDKTSAGRGGMWSKIETAKRLSDTGITVHIANGKTRNVIEKIISGKATGTVIHPNERKTSNIKRHLAHAEGLATGSVTVNACARDALLDKTRITSLLPVGVTSVSGNFQKGDVIEIRDPKRKRIGYGLARIGADTTRKQIGKKRGSTVVHYDHLYIG
jgi:glutamate 5-kinase